jgi:type IV secretory pathway TrbL component
MGETLCALILGLVILAMMCLIAANMIILLCSSWILLYAGVFFLGFGGSRWTSDIAINYFKTVLGVAASIMTMVLIIGIGNSILNDYYQNLSDGIHLKELTVVAVVSAILMLLVSKVPQMVAGIINGSSISGPGGFGAGAAMGAVALGGAAVATGGAAAMAGAKQAFGGASALNAAFKQANANMSSGQGAFKSASVGAGSGGNKTSSFAAAMNTGANYMSDVAANLGKGTAKAAKEGISNRMESARESLSNTAGGKIASAIREQEASQNASEAQTDTGNSHAGSDVPDSKHDEVNNFVNKV